MDEKEVELRRLIEELQERVRLLEEKFEDHKSNLYMHVESEYFDPMDE